MLNRSTEHYGSTFYLRPPIDSPIKYGIFYLVTPVFRYYYDTYSRIIDKEYCMKCWENRYNSDPHTDISNIYGEEMGYIYNAITDKTMKGLFVSTMLHRSTIPEMIEKHKMLYYNVSLFPNLVPTPRLIIPSYPPIIDQSLLHEMLDEELHVWKWTDEIDKAINLLPPRSTVEVMQISGQYKRVLYSYLNRRDDIRKEGRKYVKTKRQTVFSFWH